VSFIVSVTNATKHKQIIYAKQLLIRVRYIFAQFNKNIPSFQEADKPLERLMALPVLSMNDLKGRLYTTYYVY